MHANRFSFFILGLLIGILLFCSGLHAQQVTAEQMEKALQLPDSQFCNERFPKADFPNIKNCEPECSGSGSWTSCMNACNAAQAKAASLVRQWNRRVEQCGKPQTATSARPSPIPSTGNRPSNQPTAPSTSTVLQQPSETPKPNPIAEQLEKAKKKDHDRSITNRMDLKAAKREHEAAIQKAKESEAIGQRQLEEMKRQIAVERERIRQQQEREARREREANTIPPGWDVCKCPAAHGFAGKVVFGIRYHGPDVGSCP